ncbi:MAG: hydrogenase expression/formation protein HypD, partial [Proteobacteria bacterium]|nr:hydrogenase expression/formation protein HypD [Pseudomonadota bacterium]
MNEARAWLEKIHALDFDRTIKIMNVCGGHERSITHAGLRGALPKWVELVPGPGCPVCVCPEEDVYQAMQLALQDKVILVAFGDMLRVPVNVRKGEVRSLAEAQAAGADVRPIASPLDARKIARDNPDRPVVFFAAGFETTTAPVAAMLAEGLPDNLSILLSGRLTWPAVAMLLESGAPGFDALVAPGHVSTVMGPEEWTFVV